MRRNCEGTTLLLETTFLSFFFFVFFSFSISVKRQCSFFVFFVCERSDCACAPSSQGSPDAHLFPPSFLREVEVLSTPIDRQRNKATMKHNPSKCRLLSGLLPLLRVLRVCVRGSVGAGFARGQRNLSYVNRCRASGTLPSRSAWSGLSSWSFSVSVCGCTTFSLSCHCVPVVPALWCACVVGCSLRCLFLQGCRFSVAPLVLAFALVCVHVLSLVVCSDGSVFFALAVGSAETTVTRGPGGGGGTSFSLASLFTAFFFCCFFCGSPCRRLLFASQEPQTPLLGPVRRPSRSHERAPLQDPA
jgi:hypothetical protein